MAADILSLREKDVIRVIEAYLESRGLCATLDALERETGLINSRYPPEALALRQLFVDGKWSDAVHYVTGLVLAEDALRFILFEIMKQKYVELVCVYEEVGNELYEDLGSAIAICFEEMSTYCDCPEEHENLRRLATMGKLSEDPNYKDWNPLLSRKDCFNRICPVAMEAFKDPGNVCEQVCEPDRLMNLFVKGVLYESCESYCQLKATTQSESVEFTIGSLIGNMESLISELRLYSWLQTVPWVTMSQNFIHRSLTVEVDSLVLPKLKACWTDSILRNSTEYNDALSIEPQKSGSSAGMKEKFWNKRITNNLISNAPEILKRAEEVVQRWETRHLQKANYVNKVGKDQGKDKDECSKNTSHQTSDVYMNFDLPTQHEDLLETILESSSVELPDSEDRISNCSSEAQNAIAECEALSANRNEEGDNELISCLRVMKSPVQDISQEHKESVLSLLKAKKEIRESLLNILKGGDSEM